MAHKIIVRLKPDGTAEVAVEGLAGTSCTDVTKAIERALGTTTSDKRTPDFLLAAPTQQQQRHGGHA